MKRIYPILIAILIIGCVFVISWVSYKTGYRHGIDTKGTWYYKTDTIQRWYFKPE